MSINLVAIYDSETTAEKVRQALLRKGSTDVRLGKDESTSSLPPQGDQPLPATGLFSWLIGSTDAAEQAAYKASLHGDRTAVSVHVEAGQEDEIHRLMEEFNPIGFETPNLAPDSTSGTGETSSEQKPLRVRSHAVGSPVGETIILRDERLVIEDGQVIGGSSVIIAEVEGGSEKPQPGLDKPRRG